MSRASSPSFVRFQQLGRSQRGGGHLAGCARTWARIAVGLTACALAACAGDGSDASDDGIGSQRYSIAEEGSWHIPPATIAIGEGEYVPYTGAGPWVGEDGCGGGLLEGSGILRDYLQLYFPQIDSIGGYSCRPIVGNASQMSVHATGRALDIMIPTVDGASADNSAGDPIGNWLIENSEFIGIQYIIWDRWQWSAHKDAPKDSYYSGEHPHNDHLHVELTPEAAALAYPFFQGPMDPPSFISCGVVPAAGGIVDEGDDCSGFFGPTDYWRVVDGQGQGGSLLWTDAYQGDTPSNWGRWGVDLETAGRYKVEVYLEPEFAVFDKVRYEVMHAGTADAILFDQGSADAAGWYSIGAYDFAAGGGQSVSLYDNTADPVT
ncbi:MAG TPA: hypothetical protein VMZ28_28750, partial [Kofleriaceae bacterium]|nr:hypothetical protein [Kofleriaceae bacterium]